MNFLPTNSDTRHQFFSFMFGAPVALLGTAFVIYLVDLGGRTVGM